jgi:hypothetical protein
MKTLPAMAVALWLGAGSESGPLEGPLTWDGLGVVKIGMSLPLAATLALDRFVPGDVTAADECREVHLRREPRAVFMVDKGTIVRVGTRDARFATAAGVKVGDTEEQAKLGHPGLQLTPHKYDEAGHYLTLRSADGASALVFETDGRKVVAIRAGRLPAAEYVEGCS